VVQNDDIHIRRLVSQDRELARTTFTLMGTVFGEKHAPLSDGYIDRLLARPDFWGLTATRGATVVGGLTAHTLMMTAYEGAEIFLYDIAVAPDHQRRGVGRRLIDALRREANRLGLSTIFVPADDADTDAVAFYSAQGGTPSKVTFFEFSSS